MVWLNDKEKDYLYRILDLRLEEVKDQRELIEERFKSGFDTDEEYVNNINNCEITRTKIEKLMEKLK